MDTVVVVVVSVAVVVVVDVLVTVVEVVEHWKLAHAQVSCKQFCILAKSVISVISQQLIGPHFAAAAVGSLSQSPKPLRSSLLVLNFVGGTHFALLPANQQGTLWMSRFIKLLLLYALTVLMVRCQQSRFAVKEFAF